MVFGLPASPLKCTELYFSLLEKRDVVGCGGCLCGQSATGLSAAAFNGGVFDSRYGWLRLNNALIGRSSCCGGTDR